VRTGRRSEGLFFAGMSFITKIVGGAGIVLAGILASTLGKPGAASVDPGAIRNLALLYLPTLIALYGTGMLILSRYKITRAQHEGNLRKLAEVAGDAPAVESAAVEGMVETIASTAASPPVP
jgi:glycoside/pentoside/hexuronide:cation symporter, GPH family